MLYTQICEHGKLTVSEGKSTGDCRVCAKHFSNEAFYVPDLTERFNLGLGCLTTGTRDAEKKAKSRGLVPIGDAKPHEVFRNEKKDTITPILEEGRRKMHNLGAI
jgi:hypothetical protein